MTDIKEPTIEYTEDGIKTYDRYEPFLPADPEETLTSGGPESSGGPSAAEEEQGVHGGPAGAPGAGRTIPGDADEKPKRIGKGLRIFLVILAVLVLAGGIGAAGWRFTRPEDWTMSEAFGSKDRQIWYHASAEAGSELGPDSPVVSALVFEGGEVTYYRAPEGLTLKEAIETNQSKIYNRLRKENIVFYKTVNNATLETAEAALDADREYKKAKKKAEAAEKKYQKQLKELNDLYSGNIPEDVLKNFEKKQKKVEVPDPPKVKEADAELAKAFLEGFEEGDETPVACTYRLYVRNQGGARELIAFNAEEYPGFSKNRFVPPVIGSYAFTLLGDQPILKIGSAYAGGYVMELEGESADALLTPCKKNAVYLLDTEAGKGVFLNKGEETMKVEMGTARERDAAKLDGAYGTIPEGAGIPERKVTEASAAVE